MKENILLISLFIFLQTAVFSQDSTSIEPAVRKYQFIPSIGAGVGYSKFFGDITDKGGTNVHWLGNRFGFDGTISMNLSNSFYWNLNGVFGKLSGNENTFGDHRNFETTMMNFGTNIEYNFGGLFKKKRPVITPYISVGFYYGMYDARTDLFDANGNLYYYWTDGKIRDIEQNSPDADFANPVSRDYNYETKLNANTINAFSVPVGVGIDFHLGKRFVFRLNSKYFYSLSDKIDGAANTPTSVTSNDGFLYNSVSVLFNLIPDKSNYVPKELLRELDADDYDSDGVPDIEDECGGTKQGVSVNSNGCPIDVDNDGIPDYLDSEPNSPTIEVGTDGVVFDFLKIAQNAEDSLSILHALLKKYPNLLLKTGDQKFTVYVGTFNQNNKAQKLFLQSIPGIIETKINDSLFVYSVGSYSQFEDAQQKTNELQIKGVSHAFEVPGNTLNEVAGELEMIMKDTIETPEAKKAREEKYLAELVANSKPLGKEGNSVAVSAIHSEEKHDFAEKKETETVIKTETNALATVSKEEKIEEAKIEAEKVDIQEVTTSIVQEKAPEIIQVKTDVPKAVVKFSLDVVEHADKTLPFAVLLLMQRETLTMQTVRVMGAKIYTVGSYKTVADVQKVKAEVEALGVSDATIIGLINNIKVTQKEAEDMLKKIGQ